jgi:hypothetical protein
MTTYTDTSASPRGTLASHRTALLGVGSGLLAATLTTLFAHDWGEVAVSVTVIAVVTAGVWGYVVPRALGRASAGGTALGLAVPAALLVVPAFWSGLPLVLGVAALVVGNAGRKAPSGAGKCIAAIALAALTVLFYLFIYVSEGLAGETGFLLD